MIFTPHLIINKFKGTSFINVAVGYRASNAKLRRAAIRMTDQGYIQRDQMSKDQSKDDVNREQSI